MKNILYFGDKKRKRDHMNCIFKDLEYEVTFVTACLSELESKMQRGMPWFSLMDHQVVSKMKTVDLIVVDLEKQAALLQTAAVLAEGIEMRMEWRVHLPLNIITTSYSQEDYELWKATILRHLDGNGKTFACKYICFHNGFRGSILAALEEKQVIGVM